MPAAWTSEESDYAAAVERARALVRLAELGDRPSAERAAATLREATGTSQPEVLWALEKSPPEAAEASTRLLALGDALRTRADTPDPARAGQELRRILAEPRYRALDAGPSPLTIIGAWILKALTALLRRLSTRWNVPIPTELLVRVLQGLAFALLLGVLAWLGRAAWRRGRGDAALRRPAEQPARPVDRFAESDRAAQVGDYPQAVRSLTLGVAGALGGGRHWELSPFTVRETFNRAPEPDRLRPLLLPFEAATYGHRPIDASTYARAAEAAAPYRQTSA